MPTRRQERVSSRIQEEISELLQQRVRDPRLTYVTVTKVEITADLKLATIFVSALGDQKSRDDALAGLQHASRYIRRELAQRLQMRFAPELRFMLDDTWEHVARVESLLEQLQNTPPSNEVDASAQERE
nr:30S ribosome-binding factor RbfA [Chloroflexota bacterium]